MKILTLYKTVKTSNLAWSDPTHHTCWSFSESIQLDSFISEPKIFWTWSGPLWIGGLNGLAHSLI